MEICKYCNSQMDGEFETLKHGEYYFFYICPKCHSIYEGKAKETKNEKNIINSRWYNPITDD